MKKIFVSSTFRDMNAERDIIHRVVMPRLNKIAREYGESISFCDLRWGVDTSDLDNDDGAKKVLGVCLNEIDKCKPYLIVLLGQRYGWIPDESLINAAAIKKNFMLSDKEKNISVTELEIRYGAFNNLDHTLFYFRSINGEIPRNYQNNYISDENADKLITLKKDIESLKKNNPTVVKRDYMLSWDNEKNRLDIGLEKFADMLVTDISNLMKAEWEERKTWSDYKRDRYLHLDFAEQKSIQYIDHNNLLSSCMETVNDNEIIAIKGTTGSGKSTLMSRLAIIFKEQGWHVLPIFSGLTTKTTTTVDVIRYIIDYIEDELSISLLQKELPKVEDWIDTLEVALNNWNEETKNRRLIILIDAVDQLHNDSYKKELRFIPLNLSSKVKMAFSCLEDFEIVQDIESVVMPTINDDSKKNVVNGMLQLYGKQLSNDVVKAICKKSASNNPLYLSFIVQRLNMMNQNDYEDIAFRGDEMQSTNTKNCQMLAIDNQQMRILNKCPDDVESFCTYLINSAVDMLGADFVKIAVNYIAVSRYGLREYDLESILSHSMIKWDSLKFSLFINYLDNFFIQREDGRYDFAHKNIRIGCKKMVDDDVRLHQDILLYMKGLDFNDTIRQQEFVFHCIMSDDKNSFVKYICEFESKNISEEKRIAIRLSASNAVNYVSYRDDGRWIQNLLKNMHVKISMPRKNNLIARFINYIGGNRETSMQYDDGYTYAFNEINLLLKFFSKIDYSSSISKEELNIALDTTYYSTSLSERIIDELPNSDTQIIRADSHFALGNIYLDIATLGDKINCCYARENFELARDVYESMNERYDDIEYKQLLARIYSGIAASYMVECKKIPYHILLDLLEKTMELIKHIVSTNRKNDNPSALIKYVFSGIMAPIMNDVLDGKAFDKDYTINDKVRNHLNTIFAVIEEYESDSSPDIRDTEIICSTLLGFIAISSHDRVDCESAIEKLNLSLSLLRLNRAYYTQYKYEMLLASIYDLLSRLYDKVDEIDKAIHYGNESISRMNFIKHKFKSYDQHMLSTAYVHTGYLLGKYKKSYDKGRKYIEEAIRNFLVEENSIYVLSLYDQLIEICDEEIEEIEKKLMITMETDKQIVLKERKKYVETIRENYLILISESPLCSEYLLWKDNGGTNLRELMFGKY